MRAIVLGSTAVLAANALAPLSLEARQSSWSSEVRLGYDYFSHDYQIIDQDTTNTFSEGSVRLRLAYHPSSRDDGRPEGQAQFFLGRDYWQADVEVEREFPSPTSWSWLGEISARQYRPSSTLSFSNDHVQGETRLRYRRALPSSMELALSDRIYAIAYDERTDYLYDSFLNDAEVSLRIGDLLTQTLDFGLTHRNLVVPDSTSIGYASEEFSAEYFRMSSLTTMITGRGSLEWRRYPSGSPRSGFLRAEGDFLMDWAVTDRTSVETELELKAEWYETVDPIYLNSQTYALRVGPGIQLTDRWDLKFLPGAEFYSVSEAEDPTLTATEEWIYLQESYREFMIEIVSDYLWLPRSWCDLSARVGHRDYEFSDGALDSDYWYLDLSFLAEVMLWDGLHLDLTGLFSPEKHRNPDDNTATNVLSAWIGYRF